MAGFDYSTQAIVAAALAEDIGPGDISTLLSVPADVTARGRFLAKQDGVLSGLDVCEECFRQLDGRFEFQAFATEGEPFECGDHLAVVTGPAAAMLSAERTALNFLQRLCGVATLTHEFVVRVENTGARIADTRKTTPGMRALQKRAVRSGGGCNHRFALYDGILLKDNHIAVAGGVAAAVKAAREGRPHPLKIEIEVTDFDELRTAIDAGADIVLLDNMTTEQLREAVAIAGGKVVTEASGCVNLSTVAEIATTGVDYISVGALTHSAPSIDISLDITLP